MLELNSAGTFPPGAELDIPGIDLLSKLFYGVFVTGMLLNNRTIHLAICTSIPHSMVFIPVKN